MDELDELRLRIAKARGWRFTKMTPGPNNDAQLPFRDRTLYSFTKPGEANANEYWIEETIEEWPDNWRAILHGWEIPDYPGMLAAAWELVEEAQVNNVGFDLANAEITLYTTGEPPKVRYAWEAIFYDPWGGEACKKYKRDAPTAPEAICRAWLAWKESAQS